MNKGFNFYQQALNSLARQTERYSGADIEAVVKETIETAFIDNKSTINTEDLVAVIKATQPLSKSLADKIKAIEQDLQKMNFKSAS